MGPAFMNTLKLTLICVVVMITSVVLGIVSALTSGRFTDRAIRSIAFLLTALPSYWVASILIIYVSVNSIYYQPQDSLVQKVIFFQSLLLRLPIQEFILEMSDDLCLNN